MICITSIIIASMNHMFSAQMFSPMMCVTRACFACIVLDKRLAPAFLRQCPLFQHSCPTLVPCQVDTYEGNCCWSLPDLLEIPCNGHGNIWQQYKCPFPHPLVRCGHHWGLLWCTVDARSLLSTTRELGISTEVSPWSPQAVGWQFGRVP